MDKIKHKFSITYEDGEPAGIEYGGVEIMGWDSFGSPGGEGKKIFQLMLNFLNGKTSDFKKTIDLCEKIRKENSRSS